jgi:hypothetical protein
MASASAIVAALFKALKRLLLRAEALREHMSASHAPAWMLAARPFGVAFRVDWWDPACRGHERDDPQGRVT